MTIQNEQGRTMLEMLGVLGIMGIITYGAIAGINYGMSSYKINQTYSEVQDIIQGIEDLYSWSKGYPTTRDALMTAACKNDIFTGTCTSGSDIKVNGPFGDMWPEHVESGKNFSIHIEVANSNDCTRLVQMDWKANNIKCEKNGSSDCTCNSDSLTVLEFSPQ